MLFRSGDCTNCRHTSPSACCNTTSHQLACCVIWTAITRESPSSLRLVLDLCPSSIRDLGQRFTQLFPDRHQFQTAHVSAAPLSTSLEAPVCGATLFQHAATAHVHLWCLLVSVLLHMCTILFTQTMLRMHRGGSAAAEATAARLAAAGHVTPHRQPVTPHRPHASTDPA